MPEAEKKEDNLAKEPMVELDTSGPGANVELPENENEETKTYEKEEKKNEANVTYDDQSTDAPKKSDEQSDVRDNKDEGGKVVQKTSEEGSDKQPSNQKEVEEYSEGVKKRIMLQKWKAEFHLHLQQRKQNLQQLDKMKILKLK
jgi:hypothetical protein